MSGATGPTRRGWTEQASAPVAPLLCKVADRPLGPAPCWIKGDRTKVTRVTPPGADGHEISSAQKWAITLSVMVVAFMQVLDTSVTNVVLPHLQGSLSAGLEEVSWVLTSYLAANAIIIPATG